MTFCLGMTMQDGLVAIADTRITSGAEILQAKKLSVFKAGGGSLFLMTSGLRSVRDKTVTYFEEALEKAEDLDRLYKAVNLLGAQIRKVATEDKQALDESHMTFNLHALVGGRLRRDKGHHLYLIYPQGNWVEINESRPYSIIGETNFGRPILDRTFRHSDNLAWSLKIGCLAFDSTRISANDVGFPLDIAVFDAARGEIRQARFDQEDLQPLSRWWSERIRLAVAEVPKDWMDTLGQRLALGAAKTPSPKTKRARS